MQLSVKYETVLNMTTVKALGLDVPFLLSADVPIEDRMGIPQPDRRRQQWVIRDRVQPAAGPAMSAMAPLATVGPKKTGLS